MGETGPQKSAMLKPMTGRNHPCPCGSGRNQKCCLLLTPPPPPVALQRAAIPQWHLVDEPLDELSNSVLDLVEQRRFQEALEVCERLLQEFPQQVDGLERSGLVHAARGDHATAADFYRKALAFVTKPVAATSMRMLLYRQHMSSKARPSTRSVDLQPLEPLLRRSADLQLWLLCHSQRGQRYHSQADGLHLFRETDGR